jgi:hypothetical protein
MRYLVLPLLGLFCLLSSAVWAQGSVELPEDDDKGVMLETMLSEETSSNILILDNTRTKFGRDFYEAFYQVWATVNTTLPRDTAAIARGEVESLEDQFSIVIDEAPAQGRASLVSIRLNDQLMWQDVLQPRIGIAEELAESAVGVVLDYLLNYQEIQNQLGSDDEKGTGIH